MDAALYRHSLCISYILCSCNDTLFASLPSAQHDVTPSLWHCDSRPLPLPFMDERAVCHRDCAAHLPLCSLVGPFYFIFYPLHVFLGVSTLIDPSMVVLSIRVSRQDRSHPGLCISKSNICLSILGKYVNGSVLFLLPRPGRPRGKGVEKSYVGVWASLRPVPAWRLLSPGCMYASVFISPALNQHE